MPIEESFPRLSRTVVVSPTVYQTRVSILRYDNDTWALAVEFWYRGQSVSFPTRLILPEAVARKTLEGNPILGFPYFEPELELGVG